MIARGPQDLRILIVGGGIAGLTLAALLRQRGIRPTVVERTGGYGGVGYVLALWPAGAGILAGLGLHAALRETSHPFRRYSLLRGETGDVLHEAGFGPLEKRYGSGLLTARSRLIEVLRGSVEDRLRMGTGIDRLEQHGDEMAVGFTDGSTGSYDLVVGADGIRSRVRHLTFGKVRPRYAGLVGWAFWTSPHYVEPGEVKEYWGRGRFFGLYPAPGALCCFVARAAPRPSSGPGTASMETLRREFGDLGGVVPRILAEAPVLPDVWHDGFYDLRLPRWHRGRVVLVGDSAHAVLPTAGAGASMAMESAAVLAEELCRSDARHLDLALERYGRRRRARVDRVQQQARLLGRLLATRSPTLVALRNAILGNLPSNAFASLFRGLLDGPI